MSTQALDEVRELVDFVGHHNPQVRLQACKMVTSLSASTDSRALIAQTPAMIKALARQMTGPKELSREVFKALINFGESDELYQLMLRSNLVSIAMEVLRDPATDLEMRELVLMFLVNMSRDEKGAAALMQEGEEVEGLHVRRLLHWFTQPAPAAPSNPGRGPAAPAPVLDPNAYVAHILTNISQIVAGRKLLLNPDRGVIAQLKTQLLSPHTMRRLGTFQIIKNCFMEESQQGYLLSAHLGLLPYVLRPIVGPEPFLHGESEYEGIDPAVRSQMTPDKRREADPQIRVLVYEILLLCARNKPSRVLLRGKAIYPILRHAHDSEKELAKSGDGDAEDMDELLETLVPYFILDEDDAQHPEQKEAEKRRQRVEQVKSLNNGGDAAAAPEETKEERRARREREAAEAAALDKPVHYLGDELGGEVRRREHGDAAAAAAPVKPVAASASLPTSAVDLDDETFPDIEPIGAAETEQLGEVAHNVKSVEEMKAAEAAAKQAAAAPAAPVYAQPASDDVHDGEQDDDEEDDAPPPLRDEPAAEVEDEEDDDAPPPLADEDAYMNGLD